ncbi:hypothetical protein BK129_12150 [Paenibacillus amylolyticus]|nr:hypothetical protein BK129_12150 [Paenibacillus amylolyticus]
MGFIFTLLGGFTAFRLWEEHMVLSIIVIVLSLYQASTLFNMNRNIETVWETLLNMIASFAILAIFIISFFI